MSIDIPVNKMEIPALTGIEGTKLITVLIANELVTTFPTGFIIFSLTVCKNLVNALAEPSFKEDII